MPPSLSSASSAAAGFGLYVHVPFCRTRCVYCAFYSTTFGSDLQQQYAEAAAREMACRRDEIDGVVQTVYLGGGTPSVLQPSALEQLFSAIHRCFTLSPDAEITIEANPDDVDAGFCQRVKALGVNRVSLGVQSFNDARLRFLRRRHDAAGAVGAVRLLSENGIDNISVDLIFGLPGQSLEEWQGDVQTALSLPVTHLSAYSLMVEEGTPLQRMVERGEVADTDEALYEAMMNHLANAAEKAGFEHYEISNYARSGRRSRHNSSYWQAVPYLGFGPAAHSYDGHNLRRANTADLRAYLAAPDGQVPHATERLTEAELQDEMVMTALRCREGIDLTRLAERFGSEAATEISRLARPHVDDGLLAWRHDGRLALTRRGIMLSDRVMADLMIG
ncbi:MAG: radical SAM family heme chaperone HemW [Alloprevotella sp.]